jgi:hypothetical protein
MAELDPFDSRLERAVHAYADHAQTSVDAVTVAGDAIGHRRTGPWAVLGRAVPVPVPLLVVSLVVVAFIGWSLTGGGPFPVRILVGNPPTPTATRTPGPIPTPTGTPTPTIAPMAPAFVTGTATSTQLSPRATPPAEGNLPPWSGAVLGVVTKMDDPRASGTGTFYVKVDAGHGTTIGFLSGTFQLDATAGAWDGRCSGAAWDGITPFYDGWAGARLSCWLTGSGAYTGLTFYLDYRFAGPVQPDELLGTIVPVEPPSP